jgi:hypothetical protein
VCKDFAENLDDDSKSRQKEVPAEIPERLKTEPWRKFIFLIQL